MKNKILLGRKVSTYIGVEKMKNMSSIFLVLSHHFEDIIYGDISAGVHEYEPTCNLAINPFLHKSYQKYMLSVENGSLSIKDKNIREANIVADSPSKLVPQFFRAFLNEGLVVNFSSNLIFNNQSPRSYKKTPLPRRQTFEVSFVLRYISAQESIIHDLSIVMNKWHRTKKVTML